MSSISKISRGDAALAVMIGAIRHQSMCWQKYLVENKEHRHLAQGNFSSSEPFYHWRETMRGAGGESSTGGLVKESLALDSASVMTVTHQHRIRCHGGVAISGPEVKEIVATKTTI